MDAVLEFSIEAKATGKQLFDLVTRTLGIREVWYFGLMYTDIKGFETWLRYDKKVTEQGIQRDSIASFEFRSKFYPEDVSQLVMEVTLHFFYMQAKDDILNEKIHCSPEASLLLASYALQAEYGPYEKDLHPPGLFAHQRLLPQNVTEQFNLTPEQWEGQIIDWWCKYNNMLRMQAEFEYLKIAQDLDMYGINYFDITNKKGTQLWLGVDAFGLNIYNHDNKISPKISFPWGEIRNVEYHGKKFSIMPEDKNSPDFIFYVPKTKISDLIMQLCVGNHDLYLKRRKVDTMEIQQMKAHAKEEKARKMAERDKLEKEKAARLRLEREREELQDRMRLMEEEIQAAYHAKLEAEHRVQILEERVKIAEEHTHSLTRKKLETEEEIRRVRASAIKSEEEKMVMKNKVIKAKEQAANLLMTSQQTQQERDELMKKLERAKVMEQYNNVVQISNENSVDEDNVTERGAVGGTVGVVVSHDQLSNGEIDSDDIVKQLEKENQDYLEQSRFISQQLSALQTQMHDLRMEEEMGNGTSLEDDDAVKHLPQRDQIHVSLVRQMSLKQTVYDRSKAGSTKSRIAFFEEL